MQKYGQIFLTFLLCIIVIALGVSNALQTSGEHNLQKGPLDGYTVVIDAGHGGEDGGTIGIHTKVKEADINLPIALYLKECFESMDAQVVLTRKSPEALCGSRKYNKQQDMAERARIISMAQPIIVISIHCNSYPATSVHGAQTFFYPDSEVGLKLATSIQNSLVEMVDSTNKRIPKEADFFMLRNGNSTNVMVECGFLSSPAEEALLITEEYQQKLACAIFDGAARYLNIKE